MMRNRQYVYQNEENLGEGASGAGVVTEGGFPETAPESTDDGVNWGEVTQDFDASDDDGFEGDEAVVEAPAPATTEAPTPPTTPAVETPATTTPATSQEEPLPPAPAVTATTPEAYQEWRQNRITQLEQTYALDEASANAMLTEPETVLPKIAAQLHVAVLENAMRAMQAMVPVMVQQMSYHSTVESKAKNLFTSVNPDLADPKLEPVILELGGVYRNVNKAASPEVAAQAIGNLVRAALGIAAPAPAGYSAQPAATPHSMPAVVPFSPARGAGGGQAPAAVSNPFDALSREMEAEGW